MKSHLIVAVAATLATAPAVFADSDDGDAAAGEAAFKQCQTCHVVTDGDGNTIAGRTAKTGPNLYGVIGRMAGAVEGYKYSKSMVAAGEAGLVWDDDNFVEYIMDPTGYLRAYLEDSKARSKMSFKVRKEDDAKNLAAFLESVSPEMDDDDDDNNDS